MHCHSIHRRIAPNVFALFTRGWLLALLTASSLYSKAPVSSDISFGNVSRDGGSITSSGKASGAEFAAGRSTGRIYGDSSVTVDGDDTELHSGLLLVSSPKKRGLFGKTKSKAVMGAGEQEYTAECRGTMAIAYVPDEVLKVICKEGTVVVRLGGLLDAEFVELQAGQALVVNPAKARVLPRAVDVDLTELNATSALMSNQFGLLPRQEDVDTAANDQQGEIRSGALSPTPLLMNGSSPRVFLVRERGVEGANRRVAARRVAVDVDDAPEQVRGFAEIFPEPENVIENGRVFAADDEGSFLDVDDNGVRTLKRLSSGKDIEEVLSEDQEPSAEFARFLVGDDLTTSQFFMHGTTNENGEPIPIKLDAVEVSMTDFSEWPSYLNKPAAPGVGENPSDAALLAAFFANPDAPTVAEMNAFLAAFAAANAANPVRIAFVPVAGGNPIAWWDGRALVRNAPMQFATESAEFDVKGNVWIGGRGGFSSGLEPNTTKVDFGDRSIALRTQLGNRAALDASGKLDTVNLIDYNSDGEPDPLSTYSGILGPGRVDANGEPIQWGIRRIIEENRDSAEAFGNDNVELDGYGIYDVLADALTQVGRPQRAAELSNGGRLLDYGGVQADGEVGISRELLGAVAIAQNFILVNSPRGVTGNTVFDIERLIDPETDELAAAFVQRLREIQRENASSPRFLSTGGSLSKADYTAGTEFLATRDALANAAPAPTFALTVRRELNALRAVAGIDSAPPPVENMTQADQLKILGALREIRNTATSEADVVSILNETRFQIASGASLSDLLFEGNTAALGDSARLASAIEDAEANVTSYLSKAAGDRLDSATDDEKAAYEVYRKYLVDVAAAVLIPGDTQNSPAFELHKQFIEESIFNQFIEIAKGDIRIEGSANAPTQVEGGRNLEFSAAESIVVTGRKNLQGEGLTGIRSKGGTLVIVSNDELKLDDNGQIEQASIERLEASLARTPFANFQVKLDAEGKPFEDAQGNALPAALIDSPLLVDDSGAPVINDQGFATFAYEVDPSHDPRWQIGSVKIGDAELEAAGDIAVDARGVPRDTVLPFLVDFADILRAPRARARATAAKPDQEQSSQFSLAANQRGGAGISTNRILEDLFGFFSFSDAETQSIEDVRAVAKRVDSTDGASLELSGEVTFATPAVVNLMARDGSALTLNSIQVSPKSTVVFEGDNVKARLIGEAIFVGLGLDADSGDPPPETATLMSFGDLTIDSTLIAVQRSKLEAGGTLMVSSSGADPNNADGLLYINNSELSGADVVLSADASNLLVRRGRVEAKGGSFTARTLNSIRITENPDPEAPEGLVRRVLFWANAPITAATINFSGGADTLDPDFGDYAGDVVIAESNLAGDSINLGANDFLVLAGDVGEDALNSELAGRQRAGVTATEGVLLVGGRTLRSSFDGLELRPENDEFGGVYVTDYRITAPLVEIESADDIDLYNTSISGEKIIVSADAVADGFGSLWLERSELQASRTEPLSSVVPSISLTSNDTWLVGAYISNPTGEVLLQSSEEIIVDSEDAFILNVIEGNDVVIQSPEVDLYGTAEDPVVISGGDSVRIESESFYADFVDIEAVGAVSIEATEVASDRGLTVFDSNITSLTGSVDIKGGSDVQLLGVLDSTEIHALAGSINVIAENNLNIQAIDPNKVRLSAKDIWLSAGNVGSNSSMILQNAVMNADTIRALSYRTDDGDALIVDSTTMNANQLIQLFAGGVSALRFKGDNFLDASRVDLAARRVTVDSGGSVVNRKAGGVTTVYSDIRQYNRSGFGSITNQRSQPIEKSFSEFAAPQRPGR